jgi:hypothetical protein
LTMLVYHPLQGGLELKPIDTDICENIILGESVRVADETDIKTFQCKGTILECLPTEIFMWTNPVKVTDSCDRIIGCVVLTDDDSNVIDGEFFLDYYTPERLNLETGIHKLYPKVYTKAVNFEDSRLGVDEKVFNITKISLVETAVGDAL